MSQTEYPAGPCPPKEQVVNHIRSLFQEVGPHSLTMKILRTRLSSIYKIDFKEHTTNLSNWVQEVISEPNTSALMNESHKESGKKVGGTRKSKSTTKKSRDDKKDDKKKKKKHKAEGEPKRALSAFFFFSNEKRPAVQEEVKAANDGKMDVGQTGKKLGELWAQVSAEEKAKYEDLATKDKERYKTEYDAWVAAGGKKESGGKKSKKVKDENAPKKPITPYFAYMAEVGPAIRQKSKDANDGKMDIAAVGKEVGALWGALSAEEKAKYEKISADDKLRYERECQERGIPVKTKTPGADAAATSGANDGDDSDSSSSSSDSDDE